MKRWKNIDVHDRIQNQKGQFASVSYISTLFHSENHESFKNRH